MNMRAICIVELTITPPRPSLSRAWWQIAYHFWTFESTSYPHVLLWPDDPTLRPFRFPCIPEAQIRKCVPPHEIRSRYDIQIGTVLTGQLRCPFNMAPQLNFSSDDIVFAACVSIAPIHKWIKRNVHYAKSIVRSGPGSVPLSDCNVQ